MNYWIILIIQVVFFLQSPNDNEAIMPDRLSNRIRNSRANTHRERMKYLNQQKKIQSNRKKEDKTVDFILKDSNKNNKDSKMHLLKKNLIEEETLNHNLDETINNIKVADAVILNEKTSEKHSTTRQLAQEFLSKNNNLKEKLYVSGLTNHNASEKSEFGKPESEISSPVDSQQVSNDKNVESRREIDNPSVETPPPKDSTDKDDKAEPNKAAIAEEKNVDTVKEAENKAAIENEPPRQPALEPGIFDEPRRSESPTSKTADGEKPTIEKSDDDDLQSFEEWKKKQIQSKENAVADEKQGSPARTVRTKKTQMNYASQDCGAKVLSHNSEAKNVGAILDENKDLYMLNPCSNRVWFVVELCEPIQVEQVQLANLELFSSMPHIFNLYISERFPAREWRSLGTFEARNERAVQTFVSKRDDSMFAKYLKFEMKSHFGNEHFCPLTLIRVLGVSMVEEYENHEEEKSMKDHQASDKAEKSDSSLHSSNAQDVEKAEELSKNADDPAPEQSGSIGKVLNMVKSAVDNLLGNGKAPSNATLSANDSDFSSPRNDSQDEAIDPEWESPVTLVTNKTEVGESPRNLPVITLIETGDGQEFDAVLYAPPIYPLDFLRRISSKSFGTKLCWFLEFMYRVSLLSCIVPNSNRTLTSDAFPYFKANLSKSEAVKEKIKVEPNDLKDPDSVPVESQKSSAQEEEQETVQASEAYSPPLVEDPPDNNKIVKKEDNELKTSGKPDPIKETENKRNFTSTSQSDSGRNATSPDSKVPFQAEKTPDTKPICDKAEGIGVKLHDADHDHDNDVERRPSKDKQNELDAPSTTSKIEDSTSGREISIETQVEATLTQKTEETGKALDANNSDVPFTSVNNSTSEDSDAAPADAFPTSADEENSNKTFSTPVPPVLKQEENTSVDTVVINPGTNQKESVLMRLSNRIRTLEQNLSLSSAYLESLSRRYKRQMDEMQRAFNQTQNRLNEMTQLLAENDRRHEETHSTHKREIANLRIKLEMLEESNEQLNRFMIARHFCLMAIEGVLLIVICLTCFGVRQLKIMREVKKAQAILQGLQRMNQPELRNGYAKSISTSSIEPDRQSSVSRAATSAEDMVLVSSNCKSRSSLNVEQLATLFASSSNSSISSTSLHRKKALKTINSPIKKRRNSHQSGKIVKSSGKLSSASLSTSGGRWTTEVAKEQNITKSKKHACSKKESKKSAHKTRGSIPSNGVYPGHDNGVFPSSSCYTAPSFWEKYASFSSLVGKAR